MTSDNKREVEEMYKPLIQWIKGNPEVDNNMKSELFEIVHDMITATIDSCYKKGIEAFGRKK